MSTNIRYDIPADLYGSPKDKWGDKPLPAYLSSEWLAHRGMQDAWELERSAAVVLINATPRFYFTPQIWNDPEPSHDLMIVPMHKLRDYSLQLEARSFGWLPMADVFDLVHGKGASKPNCALQLAEVKSALQSAEIAIDVAMAAVSAASYAAAHPAPGAGAPPTVLQPVP